jgi:hypothetical protein
MKEVASIRPVFSVFNSMSIYISGKILAVSLLILTSVYSGQAQDHTFKVMWIEIGGLTYENLERAYTPNLNQLINSGYLTSLYPDTDLGVNNIDSFNVSRKKKFANLIKCLDGMQRDADFHYISNLPDTILSRIVNHAFPARTNVSLVNDVLEQSRHADFTYMRFRPIPRREKPLQRFQINYLTTLDSLLGVVFQTLQERRDWDSLQVIVTGDGTKAHNKAVLEMYSGIPLLFYGSHIKQDFRPFQQYTFDDILKTLDEWCNISCTGDSVKTHRIPAFKTDSTKGKYFYLNRPDIIVSRFTYENKLEINIYSDNPPKVILYTINGDDPLKFGKEYKGPIVIDIPGVYNIKAVSRTDNVFSSLSEQQVILYNQIQEVISKPPPDDKYSADGPEALIDGHYATTYYLDKGYLGYQGQDVELLINFGAKRNLKKVELSTLQDYVSWIFYPKEVTFYLGNDFQNMIEVGHEVYNHSPNLDQLQKRVFTLNIDQSVLETLGKSYYRGNIKKQRLNVRCLKIVVKAMKTTPNWFKIPGVQSWFFTDEIHIE